MNKLFFTKSASDFCEALPLGNGRLGATIYGGVNDDVYALNDDTLWSGYPRKSDTLSSDGFKKMKALVASGEIAAAEQLYSERIAGHWSQCYLPAGNLVIKGGYTAFDSYVRELDLETALHTVRFGNCRREAFASYPDDVICIRYEGELPELKISLESILNSKTYYKNSILFLEGEAPGDGVPAYVKTDNHYIYSDEPQKKGMRYGIGVAVKTDGVLTDGTVKNATQLELYVTVKTSFAAYERHPYLDGTDYIPIIEKTLKAALQSSYDEIKARHVADYRALFSRVEFTLEGGRDDLPTDERLALHKHTPDPSLYALCYQFGRYLTIASSREGTQPTNLQGIWNVLPVAPWSGNYTVNINTQMNYWGTLSANLAECCEPLNRFVCELSEAGKTTAKKLFDADGFCVNHNTDLWRITHPVGNWSLTSAQWGYFPLAGAWLTRHLYEYYLDTKDKEFLNGKAYDAILGSARFCDSMLEDIDGKLMFTPANSPENRYLKDGKRLSLSRFSAMYQSIVRDALEICVDVCDITGRDTDYARYLEERLLRIPLLSQTYDGRIAEWDCDYDEADPLHRHISHLYSFYPAKRITDSALLEACKKSLNIRGDRSTGWSSAWKMCLWAYLGDNERSLRLCDELMNVVTDRGMNMHDGGGLYPNLLCAHPPFQIDGNFGLVAGIGEIITSFYEAKAPLPKLWKTGEMRGIRINGKTVNIKWKDGKLL